MLTEVSLYAIVFDNGRMIVIPGTLLSEIMLSPNYFFMFCSLIENLQKMAYITNTLYIK